MKKGPRQTGVSIKSKGGHDEHQEHHALMTVRTCMDFFWTCSFSPLFASSLLATATRAPGILKRRCPRCC